MRKIKRSDLNALKETATLLDEKQQRFAIGGCHDYFGGSGCCGDSGYYSNGDSGYYSNGDSGYYSNGDSYSQYDFFNWNGEWLGGYVDGLGYVPADTIITGITTGCYKPDPYPGQELLYQAAYDMAFENGASGKMWDTLESVAFGIISGIIMNPGGEWNGNDPGMQAINLAIWQGLRDGKCSYEERNSQ